MELILTVAPMENIFNDKISKMVRDTMLGSKEVRQETAHGLSIGIMTFGLGWPWTILGPMIYPSNICNTVRDTMLDTMDVR